MIEAQLNMFDAVVIIVLLLSTLLAFFRGFVREVLSLGAWVGAAMITVYAFEPVAEMLQDHVTRPMVAYLIAGVGTYITALLCISFFNMMIIRYVKSGEEVGMLDNFLGMIFGCLRGGFIVSLGYLVLTLVIDEENPPNWVKTAATRDIAQNGAIILAEIAPGYLEDISSLSGVIKGQKEGQNPDSLGVRKLLQDQNLFSNPKIDDTEVGYSNKDRQLMDNVLENRTD